MSLEITTSHTSTPSCASYRTSKTPLSPSEILTPRLHAEDAALPDAEGTLTDKECGDLFQNLDADKDGKLTLTELTAAMELEGRRLKISDEGSPRIETMCKSLWRDATSDSIDVKEFLSLARSWQIPSQRRVTESVDGAAVAYERRLPLKRRLLAHWSVEGPMSTFVMCIVGLQIALGIYYLVHTYDSSFYPLLGSGVVVAKGAAGVLYPSLALVLLSSSRRLGTALRGWGWPSRFINWDRSQNFHIILGWTILIAATIHGLAHLSGTFVQAAQHPDNGLLEAQGFPVPITYSKMVATRAGTAGILSLALLFAVVITAHGRARRRHFNMFQLTHLLIFAFVVTLLVHSSQGLIQPPVLGYWLIAPMLVVLWDRLGRIYQMSRRVPGVSVRLSSNSLCVVSIPEASVPWKYSPGQYVLLRCQEVSWWEWHPFTIVGAFAEAIDGQGQNSFDRTTANAIEIYMKDSGDWTKAIYQRCEKGKPMTFTVDGPFGSPAASMDDFDHLIVIGANVGITPYAGWVPAISNKQIMDLHWIVRDRSAFEWFSDLLNENKRDSVYIHTYVTAQPPESPVAHACRYLNERYRTLSQPHSLLTGLDCQTRFGRPNLQRVFDTAISRLPAGFSGRVGVFFCGPNYLGMEISDRCSLERARSGLRWEFKGEVF